MDTDEEDEDEGDAKEQSDDAEDEEDEEEGDIGDKHQTGVNVAPHDNKAGATLLPPAPYEEEPRRADQADQAQKESHVTRLKYQHPPLPQTLRPTPRACPYTVKKPTTYFQKDSWQENLPRTSCKTVIYRMRKESVEHVANMLLSGDVCGLETEMEKWVTELFSDSKRLKRKIVRHRLILDIVARDSSR